jgi:hypothetical protein
MRHAAAFREHYRNALLEVRTHLGGGWRVVEIRDEAVNWALFASTRRRLRAQGWKIHIASSIRDAPRLFAAVVPALLASGCAFKVPASIDDAIAINSGRAGRALIGKIVTAYPGNDGEVAGLAGQLDQVWQSDQAPEILTDLRLRPDSAIYIRFGAFTSAATVVDARGIFHGAVRRPDGALVPDERRLGGLQPPWARSPIESAQPVQTTPQRELKLCGRRYLLLGTLQSAPKGETFLATGEDFAKTCVIKSVRRGVGEDAAGADYRNRLQNESRFLKFLAARGFRSPKLIASADGAIAVEDIDGIPLHELPRAEIGRALKGLTAAVAELHRLGVVHRDLKSSNAILAGDEVYLLDFELAAFAGATDAPSGGTAAHMSPEHASAPAAFASDIFALGASLAHAALGVDSGTLAPGVGRLRALLISTGQMRIARIVAAAMHADPQKRPTACDLEARLAESPEVWPAVCENSRAPTHAAKSRPRRLRKIMEAASRSAGFIKDHLAQSPPIVPARGPSPHAIASGLAGNIVGLAAIDLATRRVSFDGVILDAAEVLARDVKPSPALGFFTGQAGAAFVLALAGQKYKRTDLLATGRQLFVAAAENVVEVDLFFGTAGIVWGACLLASILRRDWPLRAVEHIARRLKRSVSEKHGILVWAHAGDAVTRDAAIDVHLGAAHGSAGIALSLAVWGRDTGCARSLDLARDTFLRLFQSGRTSDGRALRHRLDLPTAAHCGTWCHGSAGYLWCMLHAFGDDPSLRAPVDWAVRALIDTPLLASPCYCHGMAGQLEVWSLLAGYPRLAGVAGQRAALAAQLLEHLGFRADNLWAWGADEPAQIRPALWSGTLGPACALALFQKGGCDTLFSRTTLARIFAPRV